MRKSLLAIALAFSATAAMAAVPAVSASGASAPTAKTLSSSQNRMVRCNKDATGKKGDERKAFMKSCLSTKSATVSTLASAPTAASATVKK